MIKSQTKVWSAHFDPKVKKRKEQSEEVYVQHYCGKRDTDSWMTLPTWKEALALMFLHRGKS